MFGGEGVAQTRNGMSAKLLDMKVGNVNLRMLAAHCYTSDTQWRCQRYRHKIGR